MTTKYDLDCIVNGNDNQTNFTTQLLKLIFKADPMNTAKLAQGFPNTVHAVKHYKNTGEILDVPPD